MSFIRAKSYDAVAGFEPFWQEKIGGLIRWLKIPLWRASVTHGRTNANEAPRPPRPPSVWRALHASMAWVAGALSLLEPLIFEFVGTAGC